MEGGPPSFRQDCTCPAVLRFHTHAGLSVSRTGLSPCLVALPSSVPLQRDFLTARRPLHGAQCGPPTPMMQRCKPITHHGFGLFPFRSPLLRESRLMSFPPGTEMVQFPGCRSLRLLIHLKVNALLSIRVTPFGYLRITGCLLLPAAFRSLPRPSSPTSS